MKLRILLCMLMSAAVAYPAGKEGHGGNAVVCRDEASKIYSVEVLDLWEGREEFELQIQEPMGTAEEIAQQLSHRMAFVDSDYYSKVGNVVAEIIRKKTMLEDGLILDPIPDSFPVIQSPKCKIEQLAVYKGNGVVLIATSLWKHLTNSQQAALYLHEAIFKVLRDRELVWDSRKARVITAYLFSNLVDIDFREFYNDHLKHLGPVGPAKEVKIEEQVRGDLIVSFESSQAAKIQAEESFNRACERWKAHVPVAARMKVLYIHCGSPSVKVVVGVGSEIPIGYMAHAAGTAVGLIDGYYELSEISDQAITGEVVSHPNTLAGAVEGHVGALASWSNRCTDWKKYVEASFDQKSVYAYCEGPQELSFEQWNDSELHYVRIGSKGTIFYVKNAVQKRGRR